MTAPFDLLVTIYTDRHSFNARLKGLKFESQWTSQVRLLTPARLCVDANMFVLACGYAAICLLGPPWFARGATGAGFGVRLVAS